MPAARGRGASKSPGRGTARRGRSQGPTAKAETVKDVTEEPTNQEEEVKEEEVVEEVEATEEEEAEQETGDGQEEMEEGGEEHQEEEEEEVEEEEEEDNELAAEELQHVLDQLGDEDGGDEAAEEEYGEEDGEQEGEEDGEGVEQEEDGDQDEGEDADMAEGEDGAENAEDEENQEESQGEEYCVVDEVEGDQDSSKVEDTKEEAQEKKSEEKKPVAKKAAPAKKAPAKKVVKKAGARAAAKPAAKKTVVKKAVVKKTAEKKAPVKKTDAKKDKSGEEKKEEKDKPKGPAIRGFIPSQRQLHVEVRELHHRCSLVVYPVTAEQFVQPSVQEVLAKAASYVLRMVLPSNEEQVGYIDIRFESEDDASSAEEVFKKAISEKCVVKGNHKKDQLHSFHKKAKIDFPEDHTVALFYDQVHDWHLDELKTIFPDKARFFVPKTGNGSNKCYMYVELSSKEEVQEWAKKDTIPVKDLLYKVMPVVAVPDIKLIIQKVLKLKLQEKLKGELPSGLRQYYQDLAEMLLYFLRWAEPGEVGAFKKDTLTKFRNQILCKLEVSKRMEDRRRNNPAQRNNQGRNRPRNRPPQRERGPNQDTNANKRPVQQQRPNRPGQQNRTPQQNRPGQMNRPNRPAQQNRPGMQRRPGQINRSPQQNRPIARSNRSPGYADRSGDRTQHMKRRYDEDRRRSLDDYGAKRSRRSPPHDDDRRRSYDGGARRHSSSMDGGLGFQQPMSALNSLTGLPNMNAMQMNMMQQQQMMEQQMLMQQQQMQMEQRRNMMQPDTGYDRNYGNQAGRYDNRSFEDRSERPAYRQNSREEDYRREAPGGSSGGPQKTENAINLLLGLSKMLKGGNDDRQRGNYNQGGGMY